MRYFQPPADTRFYAGVDLHARSLFLVILDRVPPPFLVKLGSLCPVGLPLIARVDTNQRRHAPHVLHLPARATGL